MSTSTRKLMRGEIYYIKSFPTHGHEQRSGRPAVIVSNNEINAHAEVVEVCFLTLKDKPKLPTHIFIDRGPCINSTVLCEQVTSVSLDKVGDYMCQIPEHLEEALDSALRVSLGLNSAKELPLKIDPISSSFADKIKALEYENKRLHEELAITKEANEVIKEKAVFNQKAVDSANARADMYERMYNDIIDRLVSRGAK